MEMKYYYFDEHSRLLHKETYHSEQHDSHNAKILSGKGSVDERLPAFESFILCILYSAHQVAPDFLGRPFRFTKISQDRDMGVQSGGRFYHGIKGRTPIFA